MKPALHSGRFSGVILKKRTTRRIGFTISKGLYDEVTVRNRVIDLEKHYLEDQKRPTHIRKIDCSFPITNYKASTT